MATNRCQVWAALTAATAPGQTTETLIARARSRRCTIFALVEILFLFHTKQPLFLLDALATDTAAANRAIQS